MISPTLWASKSESNDPVPVDLFLEAWLKAHRLTDQVNIAFKNFFKAGFETCNLSYAEAFASIQSCRKIDI